MADDVYLWGYGLSFALLLVASRRAGHERASLSAGSLLHVCRCSSSRHLSYGGFGHYCCTFADAAYNLRIDAVGDAHCHWMRGECVSFTRPEFVGAFAVFHDVVFADKRSFGGEAEGACRNGKYVFAVERVDCDIGRQARLQF